MLFIFLHVFSGSNEGGLGLQLMSSLYGLSCGSISNYIRHVRQVLSYVLKANADSQIKWPDAESRKHIRGFVCGFGGCEAFVYGTKQQRFRPGDAIVQEQRYDRHHKFHCFAVLLWTDVYGLIIRIDITLVGSRHDRGIYNDSAPYRLPQDFSLPASIPSPIKGFREPEVTSFVPQRRTKQLDSRCVVI